ncbi:MAG: hypothetical protein N2689_10395 [Verrucomicrobiae bacterium]|nr:hypothetical protein [Verrucomicrobiae bacterium]
MKRSRSVKLVLVSGLSAGALTACGPSAHAPSGRADGFHANNDYLPGMGYYHAPYRAWFPLPYNYYDRQKQSYYYGGQWAPTPHQSITNISSPMIVASRAAGPTTSGVRRSGFGSTSRYYSTYS